MLCPITHTEPTPPSVGIEISSEDSKESGLDDQRSWVIVSEVNKVSWSSGRFERTNFGKWEYGELPEQVMMAIREAIVARVSAGQMDVIDREQIDERVDRSAG
jgi:hypothetical protein